MEVAGERIHLVERGESGPRLLLLHGYASNAQAWRAVMQRLDGEFRMAAPDMVGFGWSTRYPTRPLTGDAYAERVAGILDALEWPMAHVAGQSWGGGLAQRLAAAHPDRVDSARAGGDGRSQPHPLARDGRAPAWDPLSLSRPVGRAPGAAPRRPSRRDQGRRAGARLRGPAAAARHGGVPGPIRGRARDLVASRPRARRRPDAGDRSARRPGRHAGDHSLRGEPHPRRALRGPACRGPFGCGRGPRPGGGAHRRLPRRGVGRRHGSSSGPSERLR